jgi:hypothetical protein
MLDPVTNIEYHTADDRALSPNELEELIETEECAIELYRGTEPILSIAEPRRFRARGVDARVRHPSADPADAFIEVTATITLSLARDRCHPRGATPPSTPVSTAKAEAASNAAAEDGSEDGADTPETWKSGSVTTQVSSDAEDVETVASDRGGSGDEPATSGESPSQPESSDGDDHDEDADSEHEDNDGKLTFSLKDGPADDDGG